MRPKKTVLCVSVDEDRLSCQRFMLETRGYRVLLAENAAQALVLLGTVMPGSVDAMVTELELGEMDGNTLARRAKELHQGLPVLVLSYETGVYDHGNSADVFLPRGCTEAAVVLERLRTLVARKRGPKKAVNATEAVAA